MEDPFRPYVNNLGLRNQFLRALWRVVYVLLFRPSPALLHGWRRFLLRRFGAMVGSGAHPYPRCRVFAPWHLTMGRHSCLANDVDCYCVAPISIGEGAVVSQYSFLCAATHDYKSPAFTLIVKPITIGKAAWVAADVFIAPGVVVGDGAIVLARSVVLRDVEPATVVGGHPAKLLKLRVMKATASAENTD